MSNSLAPHQSRLRFCLGERSSSAYDHVEGSQYTRPYCWSTGRAQGHGICRYSRILNSGPLRQVTDSTVSCFLRNLTFPERVAGSAESPALALAKGDDGKFHRGKDLVEEVFHLFRNPCPIGSGNPRAEVARFLWTEVRKWGLHLTRTRPFRSSVIGHLNSDTARRVMSGKKHKKRRASTCAKTWFLV